LAQGFWKPHPYSPSAQRYRVELIAMMSSLCKFFTFATMIVATSALQKPKDVPVPVAESEAEAFDWDNYITKPRMLISEGCDASDAIIRHAHFILKFSNIATPWRKIYSLHGTENNIDHFESMDGNVSREKGNTSIGMVQTHVDPRESAEETDAPAAQSMSEVHQFFKAQKKTLIFKGSFTEAMHSEKTIADMGASMAALNRRNKLDQLVCQVKDCFNEEELGYPVKNGTKSDLCWKRRMSNETADYKANINVQQLHNNLRRLQQNVGKAVAHFVKMGLNAAAVNAVVTEDLLDFEWDEDATGKALSSWTSLLKAWNVHPSVEKMTSYFKKNAGTRDAPARHSDSVYNFVDVKAAIKDLDALSWMIRE